MKIMLAAFGLAQNVYWQTKGKDPSIEQNSFFYGAPPFFPTHYDCVVDITPFVLYDSVIIDKSIVAQRDELSKKQFVSNSLLARDNIKYLADLGIVEIQNYSSDTIRHVEFLDALTEIDLANLDLWREAIAESVSSWETYMSKVWDNVSHIREVQPIADEPLSQLEATYSHRIYSNRWKNKRLPSLESFPSEKLKWVIQGYLLNINNNLLLSQKYSAGIYDWFDYKPFYSEKLKISDKDNAVKNSPIAQGGTILSFYLPIEKISSVKELLEVREKAKGLREYLEAKERGDAGADEKLLYKILLEIESAKREVEYYQKISSYFTLPLSIIPIAGSLAEKVANDIISWNIEKKYLEAYKWHFSLLDYSSLRLHKKAT